MIKYAIDFKAGCPAVSATVTYDTKGFSLAYSHCAGQSSSSDARRNLSVGDLARKYVLLIADTLVVRFAGNDLELTSIESYTNFGKWSRDPGLVPPATVDAGQLLLVGTYGDDRLDLGKAPHYAYCESDSRLKISLEDAKSPVMHYRVSDRLIVGISEKRIAAFFLEGIVING
ncbi:MAG: hypothetical protein K1X74_10980 [Pirellulales bacterium]|nr:hypothetical protein [Pirellulales bacterium]